MRLLDIVAITALSLAVVDPRGTADFAADTAARTDANSLAVLDVFLSLAAMNGDEVASQVVLATERATTGLVMTSVWLGTVGVVGLNVCFQVESASES